MTDEEKHQTHQAMRQGNRWDSMYAARTGYRLSVFSILNT